MRLIIVVLATLTVAVVALVAGVYLDVIRWQQCDVPGSPCCGPDGEVKTDHCHKGLGCNITTGECALCGAPGQPCCDGDFTGFSLKGYTGILLDPGERIESCNTGASCDARLASDGKSWLGTRVCQSCGTKEGGSCCAPDVRYALGRCFTDATGGTRLVCNDPWAGERGTCVPCGRWAGDLACLSGHPCDDGLVEKDGFCVSCGFPGMPTCDRGEPCRGGYSVPNRSYSRCVAAGGANQPCLPTGGCGYAGMFCNAQKICELCGDGGQTCCPPSEGAACRIGECQNSRCFACGYTNMPVCGGNEPCRDGSEPVGGFCRPCGGEGQRCCYGLSIRCYDGMRCDDGTCRRPGGGGGGSGEQWKTCSGQPYTWSTIPRPISIEDANGCVATVTYLASTPEEALQCARVQYGEAVIDREIEDFTFAVTCPHTGCNARTYPGRDHESAESCAIATALGCTVSDSSCP
jgi:hypothetical protein